VSTKVAWELFIIDNIIEEVLKCANLKGWRIATAKGTEWREVNKEELKAFIGMYKRWDVSTRELFLDPLQYTATMSVRKI
jgi:hypothetical protein